MIKSIIILTVVLIFNGCIYPAPYVRKNRFYSPYEKVMKEHHERTEKGQQDLQDLSNKHREWNIQEQQLDKQRQQVNELQRIKQELENKARWDRYNESWR